MKNGEEIAQEVDYGGVLPSGDGTYQMWVSVDPDPQSKDVYLVLWSTLAPRGKCVGEGCLGSETEGRDNRKLWLLQGTEARSLPHQVVEQQQ